MEGRNHFAFDDPERQKKHPWKAALEAFAINVGVQCFDQFVMNEEFAKISFHSIKHNIETGLFGITTSSLPICLPIHTMADSISMLQEVMA